MIVIAEICFIFLFFFSSTGSSDQTNLDFLIFAASIKALFALRRKFWVLNCTIWCLRSLCVSAALEVRVPESPAVALFGTDAVLNCSFSGVSEFNLSELSVFWQLSDTKRAVHSFWQSRDQLSDQEERFSNRTSLFPDQLPAGNASLLLRRVRVADEGSYSCFVMVQTYGSGAMLMQVAGNQSQITRDIQFFSSSLFV